MTPEMMVLGIFLGALGSLLCVLLHDNNHVIENMIGGILGGLFAASGVGKVAEYTTPTIALLLMSGYVGGSVLYALLNRQQAT